MPEGRRLGLDSPTGVLQITPWERQALQLLANGRTPTEAAVDLGLTTVAIETALARVFAAMGATTPAEAVAAAHRRGLLTHEPAMPVPTRSSSVCL